MISAADKHDVWIENLPSWAEPLRVRVKDSEHPAPAMIVLRRPAALHLAKEIFRAYDIRIEILTPLKMPQPVTRRVRRLGEDDVEKFGP